MLIKGELRARASGELVELLLECHARIRSFIALARAAGERSDCTEQQRIDACADVARYFEQALPLHVRDEEESLLPRLSGHSPEVDSALASMQAQHREHGAPLSELLALCAAVRQRPGELSSRVQLSEVASALEQDFAQHLGLEESILFPCIRALSPAVQAEIVAELRARRHD